MNQILPTLREYYKIIERLPLKEKYTKEELLIPELLIKEEKQIAIYYAAHNEYFNSHAKVFIVGITPGFAQMEKSIVAARRCIEEGISLEEIPYICKKEARFAGALRKNIIQMLDELELGEKLGLESSALLFEEADYMLHTTSMLPFATFVKGKNYTGHTPELMKNQLLYEEVKTHFYPQLEALKEALIIPLGRCVEEIICHQIEEGVLQEKQCLIGFPHPSGANVNRKKQFEIEKEQMRQKIKAFYKQC